MLDKKIAAIKLISGEEILCTLLELNKEDGHTVLYFENPLRIQYRDRRKNKKYSLEPWLCIKNNNVHCIDVTKIITVHRVDEEEILLEYESFFRKALKPRPRKIRSTNRIGYVGNTNDFKKVLERLYKDTDSYERPIEDS